jgi:hypothetical protein
VGVPEFTRPYLDRTGTIVYLTDEQAAGRDDIRRLVAGFPSETVVTPEIVPDIAMPEPTPAPATIPGPRDNPEEMMK